jgi:hypothetical protein
MRKILFLLVFSSIAFPNGEEIAKVSEAIGHMIGKQLENFCLDLDIDAIAKGIKEESEGKNSSMSEEECASLITQLQEEKIRRVTKQKLDQIDAVSNGETLNENHPISTPNPSKHW